MQGSQAIKKQLNQLVKNELTAINQFFLHARFCKHWGLERLDKKEYKASITAIKQADALIERILFLEGLPNLQNYGRLAIGEDVPELLQADLDLRTQCRDDFVKAIAICEIEQDFVSRELIDEMMHDTEEHIDWLETALDLIQKTGLENYLQSAM